MSLSQKITDLVASVRSFGLAVDTKTDNLNTGKEPTVVTGALTEFYRGDKTWANFSAAVRGTALTGFSTDNNPVLATDIALVAFGKLQGQIDAQTTSISAKVATSLLGAANGVATLGSDGKVPAIQLPSYVDDVLEYANLAGFPATGETGKIYVALDTNKTYRWSGSVYVYITSGAVDSVNGQTGVVTLTKSSVGLGSVDNTADTAKVVLSASKLTTARNIAGVSFDGSASISIPFANLSSIPTTLSGHGITDAAPLSHVGVGGAAHAAATTTVAGFLSAADKTKLDGVASGATANTGTVTSVSGTGSVSGLTLTGSVSTTGNLTLGGTLSVTPSNFAAQAANTVLAAPNGSAGAPTFRALVAADIPTLNQSTTGNAATATVLATARQIAGVSFNGSANISIPFGNLSSRPTTLSGYGITDAVPSSGTGSVGVLLVNGATLISGSSSAITVFYSGTGTQYGMALKATTAGATTALAFFNSAGTNIGNITQTDSLISFSGNANSATQLATARNIAGVSFNGTADISIPFANLSSKPTTIAGYGITDALALGSVAGAALGTASAGVAATAARSDHVHPLQTTISGNAATATVLQTARNINGVSFNGSTDITVADSTKLPLAGGTVTGQTTFSNTTATTSAATGAVVVTGGVGVGGDIYAAGNVTAYSDSRIKTDLTEITDALSKVQQLTGYTYTRTDTGRLETGLVAQYVLYVLPEAVGQG